MLATTDDLIDKVKNLMGASFSKVSEDGFAAAVEQALSELGWTIPETDNKKCYWIIERTKRYIIDILLIESAHKYKYDKISLQQRFEHYYKLIDLMDKKFNTAVNDDVELFTTTTLGFVADYIPSGFTYNGVGESV